MDLYYKYVEICYMRNILQVGKYVSKVISQVVFVVVQVRNSRVWDELVMVECIKSILIQNIV